MIIEEIARELPNGFHDAVFLSHSIDSSSGLLNLNINVWVGGVDSKVELEREIYKAGVLTLEGMEYLVVEPPYDLLDFESCSFDLGDADMINPTIELPVSPVGTFRIYLFFYKLNAFIYICAGRASFGFKA